MALYVEPVRPDFWQLARDANGDYIDPLGPKDCTTHTASRLIMRANEGNRPAGTTGVWPPTGGAIRSYTGDNTGGTNHSQMRIVAANRYATTLTVRNGMTFDDFIDEVESTRPAGLSVWYRRIRDTASRRGSCTFYQNHELFIGGVDRDRGVFTDVVDPLADGRKSSCTLYHGPGEYPISLLRMAAGELNIAANPNDYVKLGVGLCYALFGRATGAAPITTGPKVVLSAPTPTEKNTMIAEGGLTVSSSHAKSLAKGQPLFRHPGGPKVTAMSVAGEVDYIGSAGGAWQAVKVRTGAPYADGLPRPTVLYVPAAAGPVRAK